MDWLTRMNAAIAYVEENLHGEIDHNELARIACCSAHNFFRIFSYMADASLAEYVRRRRLTLAAQALQNSDIKVVDVALKYGYDSPVSFARAFQVMHGVTPTEARTDGVMLKAYPRIAFQISIKGEKEMDYRIESKEAFQLFGIERVYAADEKAGERLDDHSILVDNADLWEECVANGTLEKLEKDAGDLPAFVSSHLGKIHSVCDYRETEGETYPSMLGAFRSANSKVDGYTVVDVPAHTWAIFPTGKLPHDEINDAVATLYKRIFTEWLPTSNYEQVSNIDIELEGGDEKYAFGEVWLAVRKKSM